MSYQVQRQMEREEEQLAEDLAAGHISEAEYSNAVRDMQREYNDMAREAAEEEFNRWY